MLALKVALCSCLIGPIFSAINVRQNAPWFQQFLNQGNFNLGNLGLNHNNNNNNFNNNNGFNLGLLRGKQTRCNGTGTDSLKEGMCQSKRECNSERGTRSGSCHLIGSCCIVEKTCNNQTSAKISYFTSSSLFQPDCPYRIRLYNNNVCQLRLDFEEFLIEGPDINTLQCSTDSFTVTGGGNLGFAALCGENRGQHIYIPVNAIQGGEISLNFNLRTNRTGLSSPAPSWRIKVTQLECETNDGLSNSQSSLVALYQNHKNKQNVNIRRDSELIAPQGCLQYYPESQGSYRSFNYNNGIGPMIANTNYAICFRRQRNTCSITHTGANFAMGGNGADGTPPGTGDDCLVGDSQDWLLIPGGVIDSVSRDYYCVDSLEGNTVTSNSAGPLHVVVRTDDIANPLFIAEGGFLINYDTQNCLTNNGIITQP